MTYPISQPFWTKPITQQADQATKMLLYDITENHVLKKQNLSVKLIKENNIEGFKTNLKENLKITGRQGA